MVGGVRHYLKVCFFHNAFGVWIVVLLVRACALVCAVAREGNFVETVCGRGFWFGFRGNPTAVLLYRLSIAPIDGIEQVVVRTQRAV